MPNIRLLLAQAMSLLMLVTSALAPSVAHAAAPENLTVWRIQIRLVTGNGNLNADTDDDIQVSLNGANHTWLDYGRDDFEIVDDFTYDLLPTSVRTLSDVDFIAVQKTGTDGWCVDNLTLLINGRPIYYRSFRTATQMCEWVDADDGHSPSFIISGSTLRQHSLWQGYQVPPRPQRLSRAQIESRIEAIVGDWLETRDAMYKWGHLYGPRYVEVARRNDRILRVDLDLTRHYAFYPDNAVDGNFEIHFDCTVGRLRLTIPGVSLEEHDDAHTLDTPPILDGNLRDRLQAGLSAPLTALNSVLPAFPVVPCPTVLVDIDTGLVVPQGPNQIPDQAPKAP